MLDAKKDMKMKLENCDSKKFVYGRTAWMVLFALIIILPMRASGQDSMSQGTSPFDGLWSKTHRQHTDCGYSADSDIKFSTDAAGITTAASDALGATKGRVEGNTYVFDYGIVNGVPSGKASFSLGKDCRSFTGTFSDVNGHRGNWYGKRGSSFDGVWSKTLRRHTDCGYSAKSDITFSTDAAGITTAACDALGATRGRVEGNTYVFDYGIVNGVPSGKGTFTLSADCRSFTGTFSDVNGHRGNWDGRR